MKLSKSVARWKSKGYEKEYVLDLSKAAVRKAGGRWSKANQLVFDTAWDENFTGAAQPIVRTKSRRFVIGDIHGCLLTLKALLEKIKYNKEYDVLYFTGDYVDRGPYSKGVLDFIMSLQKSTHGRTIPLLGNHEKMVMDLRRAKWEYEEDWATNNGGDATLESFGVQRVRDIPEKYFTWIKSLKPFAITDEYVIAHAGVNMKHKAPFRKTPANLNNMIWDRDVKPDPKKKVIMVVGHTPQSKSALKASAKTGKVYVDGGCARGGVLVAFNLETRKMVFQQNKEGVAKTMWR